MPLKFSKGDLVLNEEPYAWVVDKPKMLSICSFCLAMQKCLKCPGCKSIVYCDKKCMNDDFIYHQLECAVLRNVLGDDDFPPDESRMVIRALHRHKRETNSGQISVNYFYGYKRDYSTLMSHLDRLTERDLRLSSDVVEKIYEQISPFIITSRNEILENLWKCRINCHGVVNHDSYVDTQVGRAVYLAGSKPNHSCEPMLNYAQIFEGKRYVLRALRDFEVESPLDLTITYMPLSESYIKRFVKALTQYYFICSCRRCVIEARDPQPEVSKELASKIDEFGPGHSLPELYQLSHNYLEQLANDGLPVSNGYVSKLLFYHQQICLFLKKFEEGIECGIQLVRGLRDNSSAFMRPTLYTVCLAMHELGWNKSPEDSDTFRHFHDTINQTIQLYSDSHGLTHRLVRSLKTMKNPRSELIINQECK